LAGTLPMNSGAEVQTAAAATASAMFLMCSTFLVEYCSLVTRKLAIWFQSSSRLSKEIRTEVTAARHLLGTLGRLTNANLNGCHRGSAANSDRFERRLKRGRGLDDAQGHRCDRASLIGLRRVCPGPHFSNNARVPGTRTARSEIRGPHGRATQHGWRRSIAAIGTFGIRKVGGGATNRRS
jgi:hypothetical protein